MSASMAKSMGVAKVVSRVHPGLQREEWLFDFKGHFGIDHLFSSERSDGHRAGEIRAESGFAGG